jgi:hypothetical protein
MSLLAILRVARAQVILDVMEHDHGPLIYREEVTIIMILLGDILAELRGLRDDLRNGGEEEEEAD